MAIDRLPSGRYRARLMIGGQRYTATLPAEDDARIWEIEARATAALRRRAERVMFSACAARWLEGFLDDARECLELVFEDAIHDLRAGVLGCRGAGTAELASHHPLPE